MLKDRCKVIGKFLPRSHRELQSTYKRPRSYIACSCCLLLLPLAITQAATAMHQARLDLATHWIGYVSLTLFLLAYLLVVSEELTGLWKSKPVTLAAGLIWFLIGSAYTQAGSDDAALTALHHLVLEYAELFLFLLAAMTYVNTMIERNVFGALHSWLIKAGFNYRRLFWITGV